MTAPDLLALAKAGNVPHDEWTALLRRYDEARFAGRTAEARTLSTRIRLLAELPSTRLSWPTRTLASERGK